MKIDKKYGDRIYVEWIDAETEDGWKNYKDMMKIGNSVFCFTIGWYVGKTKDFLIVCHTKGKDIKEDMMGKLKIPLKWISKIK